MILFSGITIGLIAGLFLGFKMNHYIKKLNDGIEFNFMGCNVEISKKSIKENALHVKQKPNNSPTKPNCEFCQDKDIKISGKHLMTCPKCKRNSNKFNSKIG